MSRPASSIACSSGTPSSAASSRPSTSRCTVLGVLLNFPTAAVKIQAGPLHTRPFVLDAVLQLDQSIEHGLGPRGASGNIKMHRDDAVDTLQHRVIVVGAARTGAGAERHHPFG